MGHPIPVTVFEAGLHSYSAGVVGAQEIPAVCESDYRYVPRRPEKSILYEAVAGYLETFLAWQKESGHLIPRFVEREMRKFLECGIAAGGFLRVHCDACGMDRIVPYSCKCRGFCPSCCGRRMAETAAHLADYVFPKVPVRQWVLSVPFALRYRLAYNASLVKDVVQIFQRAVFASNRRRAGLRCMNRRARSGAVTFIQRFSDALNLDPHFHMLALDGVYVEDENLNPVFRRIRPPDNSEVARVANFVRRRIEKLLACRGLGSETDSGASDRLWEEEPLLAKLYGASVYGRIATGPRAGRSAMRLGGEPKPNRNASSNRCCAAIGGYSVHAGVSVPARDRDRLEKLARYAGRPPLALPRLSLLKDGRLLYRFKRCWSDGTSHVIYEPLELLERLAALIPPPRFNIIRYSGVLAPRSASRPMIIPQVKTESAQQPHAGCPGKPVDGNRKEDEEKKPGGKSPKNYSWAQLMARVFELDVLACPRCGGRMRILAAIDAPDAIKKILACLGLPTRPPPVAAPRQDMDFPLF